MCHLHIQIPTIYNILHTFLSVPLFFLSNRFSSICSITIFIILLLFYPCLPINLSYIFPWKCVVPADSQSEYPPRYRLISNLVCLDKLKQREGANNNLVPEQAYVIICLPRGRKRFWNSSKFLIPYGMWRLNISVDWVVLCFGLETDSESASQPEHWPWRLTFKMLWRS
jgi:hypothetical protein